MAVDSLHFQLAWHRPQQPYSLGWDSMYRRFDIRCYTIVIDEHVVLYITCAMCVQYDCVELYPQDECIKYNTSIKLGTTVQNIC